MSPGTVLLMYYEIMFWFLSVVVWGLLWWMLQKYPQEEVLINVTLRKEIYDFLRPAMLLLTAFAGVVLLARVSRVWSPMLYWGLVILYQITIAGCLLQTLRYLKKNLRVWK